MIFESHAHYDDEAFNEDRDELLSSMNENGISTVINVTAEYGSIDVNIDVSMGISYSSDANSPSMAIANSKEALRFCSNPKFSSNYVYFKDTL